ncbi:arginine N-succinyltransferase [Marinobacter sp. C2H3]|uniref:arginine N-succinyltransferase n=1 Tax=Marinobacter sp. C2H3 TaxID=3119003 RepID=UPI00300ECEEF
MWVVRPARPEDQKAILGIVGARSARLSSTLPGEPGPLARRIDHSLASFAGKSTGDVPPRFLFVLEDVRTGEVLGTAGIDAQAGNGEPFYNYRRDALIHASHELGVSSRVDVLYPSHGLTDHTLLCGFALVPELVDTDAFELLSRARLLFIASHRQRFDDHLIVEIQGVQTGEGDAATVPFWDSLGRHFFNMDFREADQHSGALSKTFIAELMPPNPIYVTLLSEDAQAALGEAHALSLPNRDLLHREGFRAGSYVDIFDGGPVLEARTDSVHSIVTSRVAGLHGSPDERGDTCLVAAGEGGEFRCTLGPVSDSVDNQARVSVDLWHRLGCGPGDTVRLVVL